MVYQVPAASGLSTNKTKFHQCSPINFNLVWFLRSSKNESRTPGKIFITQVEDDGVVNGKKTVKTGVKHPRNLGQQSAVL